MKILHTIKGLNIEAGGLTTATYDLVTALNEVGCATDLLSGGELRSNAETIREDDFVKVVPFDNRTPLAFAPKMREFLKQETEYNLYHTNGLWVHTNHLTCAIARMKHKPYVISPHGMLYPQALHRSYWKKWLLLQWWFKRDLQNATCIHCTCAEEARHCRELGLTAPMAVIPNPVPIPNYIPDVIRENDERNTRFGTYKVGFIGRFHPRKRIERIIQAWEQYSDKPCNEELLLIGTGDKEYTSFLNFYVKEHALKNVNFTGQLEGREKFETLASLRAIFVPSDFENFGMIVPEALMVGTPVLASTGTPWQELQEIGCGWWNEANIENIVQVMRFVFDDGNKEALETMGDKGRCLVNERYSSHAIAKRMAHLYESILCGNLKECADVVD